MHATGSRPADRYTLSMCNVHVHCERIQPQFGLWTNEKIEREQSKWTANYYFAINSKSMKTESMEIYLFCSPSASIRSSSCEDCSSSFWHHKENASAAFDAHKRTIDASASIWFITVYIDFQHFSTFASSPIHVHDDKKKKSYVAGRLANKFCVSYLGIEVGHKFGFLEWTVIITDNLICN